MPMVPVHDQICKGCGRSCTTFELYDSRCLDCYGKLTIPPPQAKVKIRQCSTCKALKPLSKMSPQVRGFICLDCNPPGVFGNECPICRVIKAVSEMATDRKCCLDCAVELDRGAGLTGCAECGKTVAMARDGAALCTECASRAVSPSRASYVLKKYGKRAEPTPLAFEEGRVCLVCRSIVPLEMYDGQGTICKNCSSGLPSDLVKRMQRCRGCNLEKPSKELLGTMYCADCRALGIEMTLPVTFQPLGGVGKPPENLPPAPQIGRIPRAIATEEE